MSPTEVAAGSSEVAILGRLFVDGKSELTQDRARYLLELGFSDEDQARMTELAENNQAGRLTETEREELLGFAKAGCLLGILHSRARRVLRKPSGRRRSG
jgi:hypothetical protein